MLVRTLKDGELMEVHGEDGVLLGFVGVSQTMRGRSRLAFHLPLRFGLFPSQVKIGDLSGRDAEHAAEDFAETVQSAA